VRRALRVCLTLWRAATAGAPLAVGAPDSLSVPDEPQIPTRRLGELVLATYYPQTRVYVANDGIERQLRQITMKVRGPR
jgi:hypothetical protein